MCGERGWSERRSRQLYRSVSLPLPLPLPPLLFRSFPWPRHDRAPNIPGYKSKSISDNNAWKQWIHGNPAHETVAEH